MFRQVLKYQILLLLSLSSFLAFSQSKSEQDLLKQGNKLFYEENYSAASSYFLQLLSLNQTSADYNYKYGTCLLLSDGEKSKPLKYLLFAATKNSDIDKEVYYYTAKALHLNYRFAEAIKYYQKYSTLASDKNKSKLQVDRQIEMCNNGKKLLRNVTDLIVESKKDYREADFFRLYPGASLNGTITPAEDLQTSEDKKRNHRVIVFIPKNSDIVYFSSYGEEGKSLDIYRVKKLPGNTWSKPQLVKGAVNTPYDEDYPYMSPDGMTFFFCSKGHNSMGGYDVFKSTFTEENESFSQPENLDFAINTPDDDILYIPDINQESAYFASKRESGIGKVHVYGVRVNRIPVLIAILKGKFVNEVTAGKNAATITIEDITNNEVIGIYNCKTGSGDYLIMLPKSGKYKYRVKPEGLEQEYEAYVDVPFQTELRPLKQEIGFIDKGGEKQIVIRNMFDQTIEDADEIIAQVLKEKSTLNPTDERVADSLLKALEKKGKDSLVDVSIPENITNEELIKLAKEQAENQQKEANELKEKLEAAYAVAAMKSTESKDKANEADNNIKQGDEIIDPLEKGMLYDEAKKQNDEAKKLSNEAVIALNLAQSLENQYKKAQKDAEVSKQYATGIEEAINSKNHDEAVKKLKEQQKYIKELMSANAHKNDLYDEIKQKAAAKRKEANDALAKADRIKQVESDLNSELTTLKREAEKAKGKKKEELESQIKDKEAEIADINNKKKEAFKNAELLTKEADQLDDQADLLTGILENNVASNKTLSESEKNQLAATIEKDKVNINENSSRIEEKTNVDRQKKFDYNDFLAKYDYYANMFNEYERLKRSLLTPDDYDKLINHNENWIKNIDDDLASIAKEEANANDEKKKALAAKREELKQLKALKEKENKDLKVEKQKLLDRLAQKDKNNENLTALNDEKVNEASNKNSNKLKEIENSNQSNERKALEKNKANKEYIKELDESINKEKKELANKSGEEKEKALTKIKTLEEEKKNKTTEINENQKLIASTNSTPLNESTQNIVNNNKNQNNPTLTTQITKTENLQNEINELLVQKAESKNDEEKKAIDKKIEQKNKELNKEEDKLVALAKDDNNKTITANNTSLKTELTKSNLNDTQKTEVNQLLNESTSDQNKANELFKQAEKETNTEKKEELTKEAFTKQNEAINKQNEAKSILENSNANVTANNNNSNNNNNNNNNGNNNPNNNQNNATTTNAIVVNTNNYQNEESKNAIGKINDEIKTIEEDKKSLNTLKEKANVTEGNAKKQLENEIKEKEKTILQNEIKLANSIAEINKNEIKSHQQNISTTITQLNNSTLNSEQKNEFEAAKNTNKEAEALINQARELREKAGKENDLSKKADLLKQANALEQDAIAKEIETENKLKAILDQVNGTSPDSAISKNKEEFKSHQDKIDNVLSQINPTTLTPEQKARYDKAYELIESGKKDMNEANQLVSMSEREQDQERKKTLLNNAESTQNKALKNEVEAENILTTLLGELNSANNQNLANNNENKALINELNADYIKKQEEINASNKSEERKAYEQNELNKELVKNIESEIQNLSSNENNLTEEEKRKRRLKIEELNRLLDAKKKELNVNDETLKSKNILTNDNLASKNDYKSTLTASDPVAVNELKKIEPTINEIQNDKKTVLENNFKLSETNDQKTKEKIENENKSLIKKIEQKEIGIADEVEKINTIEYTTIAKDIELKTLKTQEQGIQLNETEKNNVEELKAKSANLINEAKTIREKANKTTNTTEKNNLFKEAYNKEKEAIKLMQQAEQLLDKAIDSAKTTTTITASNDPVIKTVDPEYKEKLNTIESSNASIYEKTALKNDLNKELIASIETEKAKLENDYSKQSEEEKKKRRLRIEELNKLLDQKKKELATQESFLASNNIETKSDNNVSYTSPYPVNNNVSKSLLTEAKTRIDELKREENKLRALEIKRAETTNASDKKKLDTEIATQKKTVTEKELTVAKVYADINANEIKDNKGTINQLDSKIIENPGIDKNSIEFKAIQENIARINGLTKEAETMRSAAEKETNKEKKNTLLKTAFNKEKEAIALQNKTIASMNTLIEQSATLANNTGNNSGNTTTANRKSIPENPNDRASAIALKKYEDLNNKADYLAERANTVRDSANTVKKKNKPEVLAMADRLQKQSDETRTEANLAKRNYETIKTQEDELLVQQEKEKQEIEEAKNLSPEVVKMNEYAKYYELQKQANDKKKTLEENKSKENNLRIKASEQEKEAFNLKQDANNENDPARKTQLNNKSEELETLAKRNLRAADSIKAINDNLSTQINNNETLAENFLSSVDNNKAEKIRKVVGSNKNNLVVPEVTYIEPTAKIDNPVEFAKNFKTPEEVKNDIYVKSDKPAYNKENPIPVDPAPPKGIYFKVQVGAFRNPIPQDLFKEFVPINGETVGNGITRYTVGYFTQFNTANGAKNEIRGFGYNDAFVVAFKDGKRIPIYDALQALGEQPLANNNANNNNVANNNTNNYNNNANNNNANNNNANNNVANNNNANNNVANNNNANNNAANNNNNNTANNTTTNNTTVSPTIDINNAANEFNNFVPDNTKTNYYSDPTAAKAKQVEVIKGLFYTVQVGVYSKPVSLDKIYNIQPLNSELTATKKIRYTTGIYTDLTAANQRKDQARNNGIKDAFVTAYFNGKKITMEEARQLVEKFGNTIYTNETGNYNTLPTNNNTNPNNNQNNNTVNNNNQNNNTANNENNTPANNSGFYSVVLGEYANDVPQRDAEIFLTNKGKYKILKASQGGKSIYFIETNKGKTDADNIAKNFKSQGLNNIKITENKITSDNNGNKNIEPKERNDLKFQVYLGEYIDEVPEDDAVIYLNNVEKGVQRKTNDAGYTIYFTCDCASYDQALELKAHFVQEGISSIRIVPFLNGKEITMKEAFNLIYE